MMLKIAHVVNVVLTGLLTGNELGSWAVVHRAFRQLPVTNHIQVEQVLTRRYGRVMPFLMSATIASFVPVLALHRERTGPALRFGLVGMVCCVAMLVITLCGNVPINNRLLSLPAEPSSREEFVVLGHAGTACTRYAMRSTWPAAYWPRWRRCRAQGRPRRLAAAPRLDVMAPALGQSAAGCRPTPRKLHHLMRPWHRAATVALSRWQPPHTGSAGPSQMSGAPGPSPRVR